MAEFFSFCLETNGEMTLFVCPTWTRGQSSNDTRHRTNLKSFMKKRIVIAGGTGFLGQQLERHLAEQGFQVAILTRRPRGSNHIQWDARTLGDWKRELDGADGLVNMAGRSVDCRYNENNKNEILKSRTESTQVLHQAVAACEVPPRVWLNSSTATIYNDTRGDVPANTEANNNVGSDFSMGVGKAWESALFDIDCPETIQTALRTAIVMGKQGGAFPILKRIAGFGLCSPQGPGDQWISWLHIDDFCRILMFLLTKPLPGCVNVSSPNPIQNRDFNQLLKERVRPWLVMPQPAWLLKFGAVFLRTETELILKSRKVVPERLLEAGFEFEFPSAKQMMDELLTH